MIERTQFPDDWFTKRERFRLESGDCKMFCNQCGSVLYHFDAPIGHGRDASRNCPYGGTYGTCKPPDTSR